MEACGLGGNRKLPNHLSVLSDMTKYHTGQYMKRNAIAVSDVHLDIAAGSVINIRLCYAWFLIVTVLLHENYCHHGIHSL